VYVVFDPMESLAAPSKTRASGRFTGLPCDIFRIQRLENSWYAVQFYTGTDWDNWADCDNLTKTLFGNFGPSRQTETLPNPHPERRRSGTNPLLPFLAQSCPVVLQITPL